MSGVESRQEYMKFFVVANIFLEVSIKEFGVLV